jgi:phosphoglycerol transferase MdoB-like AlkP superfamily enzyme
VWASVVLAAAVMVLFLLRRRPSDRCVGFLGAVDIVWCVTSLIVKQSFVVSAAGLSLEATGWWLGAATAAAVGWVLLLLPDRVRPWVSWGVAFLATSVLYADLLHERFFGDFGSVAGLRSIAQVGRVGASVRSLLEVDDLWFWADLPVALVLVIVAVRLRDRASSSRRLTVALGCVCVISGVVGVVCLRSEFALLRQVFHNTQLASRMGVFNLHAVDLGRALYVQFGRPAISDAEFSEILRYFEANRPQRAGMGPLFGAAGGNNLVMIQVESLQSFVVGFRVAGREVTPFLNSLASGNFWFTNVTDQTEEGRSSDAELATQVSLLPPDRGAAAFLFADNQFTGLASILAARGYSTLSAVPFDGSFWNRRTTHGAYGFDTRLFAGDFASGERIGWGLNDRDFLSGAAHRLLELREPWCALLLTLSLHHPFEGFPPHHRELDVGEWEGTPMGNYLHTMRFFDHALQRFVSELGAMKLLDRTVVVLWGDHDAGFEWTREIAAAMDVSHDAAGWYVSQQVPLVISIPGIEGHDAVQTVPAGHSDVAPTVLALLGVDPGPYAFMGRNLLGSPGYGPVVGEYRCWRDSSHLYLRRGPVLADGECIDLESMKRIDVDVCRAGFEASRRQVEISTRILDHDLQRKLHNAMASRP